MMVEVQEEEGGDAGHSRKEGFAIPCMNFPTHLFHLLLLTLVWCLQMLSISSID